jgi:hypothetical protein
MFSPVGNRPPSVYWRRRIMVVGSAVLLLVLVILTVRAVTGGDDAPLADGTSTGTSPSPTASSTPPPSSTSASSSSSPKPSKSTSSSASPPASSAAPPARCAARDLAIQAVVGKSTYPVGAQPVVELQVVNTGKRPCVQDLADRQVVLMIYNGESRVWGSHDCEIQPGADDRTLLVSRAVRVSITWSGRTSQAGCKGTRQRVGAGTYTLYAELSGKRGRATQFSIG